MVHRALHEVVALHAVFVGGEIGELIEVRGAGLQLFELPVVGEAHAREEADGPVVVFAFDWIGERLSLRVALHAGVVGADIVELVGIDDVGFRGMDDVFAAGAVAFFAADIPFGDLFGLEVVVDGVAAVAGRSGGPVEVGRAIEGNPPVGSGLDVIGKPFFLLDVPLCGLRVVVVSAACEVALLVAAAVDECYVVEGEGAEWVGVGEVTQDGFGVGLGVADDVGHAGLLPAIVGFLVTAFAAFGPNEVG